MRMVRHRVPAVWPSGAVVWYAEIGVEFFLFIGIVRFFWRFTSRRSAT
jgi:hypothetical protein